MLRAELDIFTLLYLVFIDLIAEAIAQILSHQSLSDTWVSVWNAVVFSFMGAESPSISREIATIQK